jgi:hypothetical protein
MMDAARPGDPPDRKAPPAPPKHDGLCVFVGHGVAAAPGLFSTAPVAFAARAAPAPSVTCRDLAPGRGFTAPPPPARGPPIQPT